MGIERLEPSEFVQEMTRKLIDQNERILEMNAQLLRALASPRMVMEPSDDMIGDILERDPS